MPHRLVFSILLCLSLPALAEQSQSRLVTVSGHGEVQAIPDRADLAMTIESRQAQLPGARSDVTDRVNEFLREMDKLGIDRKRIGNSGLIVRPEYRWNKNSEMQELQGYYVARQIRVDLRDLSKLGALLERAVSAGVNQVSPPAMGSTKEAEFRREALRRASRDARENAVAVASSLNASVGRAHSVTAQQGGYRPPVPLARHAGLAAMADSAPTEEQNYEAGQISFSADVTASFDLVD